MLFGYPVCIFRQVSSRLASVHHYYFKALASAGAFSFISPAQIRLCGLFYSPSGVTDMPVPHKDPSLWAMLAAWLAHHSPTLYGFFLAVAVAIVRVIYGGGSVRQMTLEGTLCGLLSLTLTSGLELAGIPMSASAFVGGLLGFVGTDKVREFALKWLGKKVGG